MSATCFFRHRMWVFLGFFCSPFYLVDLSKAAACNPWHPVLAHTLWANSPPALFRRQTAPDDKRVTKRKKKSDWTEIDRDKTKNGWNHSESFKVSEWSVYFNQLRHKHINDSWSLYFLGLGLLYNSCVYLMNLSKPRFADKLFSHTNHTCDSSRQLFFSRTTSVSD